MTYPATCKYTKDHEWIALEGERGTVGVTDYAQKQLGDVVYVELPEIGRKVAAGEACCVVESVKAASDVYAPLAGIVIEVHEAVAKAPQLVNEDAYENWLFRLVPDDPRALDQLLTAEAYTATTDGER